MQVQTQDAGRGWGTYVAFPALITAGYYQYVVFPSAAETQAATNYAVQGTPLPRTWRVKLVHSGGGSWTSLRRCAE